MNDVERPIYADLIALLPQAHSDEPLGNKLDRREIDALARFCSEVRDAERAAHDAFRQEVSDAVSALLETGKDYDETYKPVYGEKFYAHAASINRLRDFIIQPTITKEEAAAMFWTCPADWTVMQFREHLEKLGYKHEDTRP